MDELGSFLTDAKGELGSLEDAMGELGSLADAMGKLKRHLRTGADEAKESLEE
jgi:hypothetical protein